jgi:hypothetical protein
LVYELYLLILVSLFMAVSVDGRKRRGGETRRWRVEIVCIVIKYVVEKKVSGFMVGRSGGGGHKYIYYRW